MNHDPYATHYADIPLIEYRLTNGNIMFFDSKYRFKSFLTSKKEWPAKVIIKGDEMSILSFIHWVSTEC
jgi:hypothetical protein